jgi:hypothetical protein
MIINEKKVLNQRQSYSFYFSQCPTISMCQVIVKDGSKKVRVMDLTVAGSRKQPIRLNKSLYR